MFPTIRMTPRPLPLMRTFRFLLGEKEEREEEEKEEEEKKEEEEEVMKVQALAMSVRGRRETTLIQRLELTQKHTYSSYLHPHTPVAWRVLHIHVKGVIFPQTPYQTPANTPGPVLGQDDEVLDMRDAVANMSHT